jgi:hypothetical protein
LRGDRVFAHRSGDSSRIGQALDKKPNRQQAAAP